MANPDEKDQEFSQEPQWEPEQENAEPELEPDLDVLANMMKGVITEAPRKVGEMRLVLIAAKGEEGLFHNGIKISAKTVLVMINGKSEPELFAGDHADAINDDTLKTMFNCLPNADRFREESDKMYKAYKKRMSDEQNKIVETLKIQEATKVEETPKAQEMPDVREDLKNVFKPRF